MLLGMLCQLVLGNKSTIQLLVLQDSSSCPPYRQKTHLLCYKVDRSLTQPPRAYTKHLLFCRVCLAVASRKVVAVSLMVLSNISLDSPAVVADRDGLRLLPHLIFSNTSILGSLVGQDCDSVKKKGHKGQHERCLQLCSHAFPACSDHTFLFKQLKAIRLGSTYPSQLLQKYINLILLPFVFRKL